MHVRISRFRVGPRCPVSLSGGARRLSACAGRHVSHSSRLRRSSPVRVPHGAALASLLIVCSLLLSACTHSAVPPKATAIVKVSPTATPIPPVLQAYAQAVQPLMRMSTSEAAALESKMKHDSLSLLGDECSTFGGDFQSAGATIRATFTPRLAMPVYYHASNGYRLLAVSTDECGLASDTNSKSEVRSAISDLRAGVSLIDYAYGLTKRWSPGS